MALVLLGTFYAAMVAAGYVVELLFGVAGLIPTERKAHGHATTASPGTTRPG